MGAIISDLKIQIIIHKFVPINFLDAKNGSQSNKNRFFYVFFLLLKGGPPTFILWMNRN